MRRCSGPIAIACSAGTWHMPSACPGISTAAPCRRSMAAKPGCKLQQQRSGHQPGLCCHLAMAMGTLGRPGRWCGLGSMLGCHAVLGRHGRAEETLSRGAAAACADPPLAHGSSCRQGPHSILRLGRLFLAALLGVCCNNHMTRSSTRCCWHDPHAAKHASAAGHGSVLMAQPAPSHICGGLWFCNSHRSI